MLRQTSTITAVITLTAILSGNLVAQGSHEGTVTSPKAFEILKSLAGEWEGTSSKDEKGQDLRVLYRVTANGSALVETEFPGTDHEMISVFHMDGDRLMMTHYCAMGNQPKMIMDRSSTPDEIVFSFAGGTNFDPEKDTHIHNGTIRLVDSDTIESAWVAYTDGEKAHTNTFYLSRVK